MEPIRVLLADDHTLVRQALRKILETDPAIRVAGEVGDGAAAVESAQRLRPRVVLMDIGLPRLNGIAATDQIAKSGAHVYVLILSMHADEVYVRAGLKAGARGYVLKDAGEREVIEAVKAVARGESYFSPGVMDVVLASYGRVFATGDSLSRLSGREREVLQLAAQGHTNRQIAERLSLSVNTIESHRKHLMEKLELRNTAELVRFAVRRGIVV